jgi:hypothetical protein
MILISLKADAGQGVPESLDAPVISDLRLLTTRNKIPYFCLKITIPQQVIELSDKKPENGAMRLEFYGKVDALDWGSRAAEADT